MNNRAVLFIIGFSGVALLALMLWMQSGVDWKKTYQDDAYQPYGTQLYYDLVKQNSDEIFELNRKRKDDSTRIQYLQEKDANYIFIGTHFYSDSVNASALLSFVQRGNTALLHSEYFSEIFWDQLQSVLLKEEDKYLLTKDANAKAWKTDHKNYQENGELLWEETTEIEELISRESTESESVVWQEPGAALSDTLRYYNKRGVQENVYAQLTCAFNKSPRKPAFEVLYQNNKNDFAVIKLQIGEGVLILNTQPLALTNYYLKNEAWFKKQNKILSHTKGKNIIWDRFSAFPYVSAQKSDDSSKNPQENNAILKFFTENESFGWALLIFVLGLLLYLGLGIKRKERAVPVIRKKENQSLAFTENLSLLYLKKGNHYYIAQLAINRLFKELRQQYGINLIDQQEFTAEQVKQLAFKADIKEDTAMKFLNALFQMSELKTWKDEQLIQLHEWSLWWDARRKSAL